MTEPLGKVRQLTLHWTAGNHEATFDHYHWCIKGGGQVVQTLSAQAKGSHTWGRNSGNLGISLCAMAEGYPVTDAQRRACAILVAELCGVYGLPIDGTLILPEMRVRGDALVATGRSRSFPVVSDHAIFARADGYYPDRWDIGPEYAPILRAAIAYRGDLVAGRRTNSLIGRIR
jgi:hypothetical protein